MDDDLNGNLCTMHHNHLSLELLLFSLLQIVILLALPEVMIVLDRSNHPLSFGIECWFFNAQKYFIRLLRCSSVGLAFFSPKLFRLCQFFDEGVWMVEQSFRTLFQLNQYLASLYFWFILFFLADRRDSVLAFFLLVKVIHIYRCDGDAYQVKRYFK